MPKYMPSEIYCWKAGYFSKRETSSFLNGFCLVETNSGSSCSFHESNLAAAAAEEDMIHFFSSSGPWPLRKLD